MVNDPLFAWTAAGYGTELVPVCEYQHDDCGSPGKVPHATGWQTKEFKPADFAPGMNLGQRTRYFPAIDIDVDDAEIVATVEDVARELVGTTARRSRSNSPRSALLYKLEGEPFKKATVSFTTPDGRPAKIEILGDGQQLVVAGMHNTGVPLEWSTDTTLACISRDTRDEFITAVSGALEAAGCTLSQTTVSITPPPEPAFEKDDRGNRLQRASAYLATIDPAISGAGGSPQAFVAALKVVRGFELNEEEAFDLLSREYNPRCVPPWSDKELRHKIRDAAEKSSIPWGFLLNAEPSGAKSPRTTLSTPPLHTGPLFLPVDDFFATCGQHVEYILKPYLPKEGFLLVDGPPKIGKTWFLGWLVGMIAATGRTVLFVEEEGSKETLRERLQPFKQPGARIHVAHRMGFKLDDERSLNRLIEEIKAAGAHVVILDPLNQLHHHLRKIGDVPAEVILAIARIIRETRCAVVLACHDRKGASWDKESDGEAQSADIAGSYAWAASADNIVAIKGVPNNERRPGEVRFYVSNPDTRNGEPFPRRLAIVRPGPYQPDSMTFVTLDCKELKVLRELWPFIPTEVTEAITNKALREASGKGQNVVQYGVTYGLRTQLLVRRVKGGGIYRVPGVVLPGSSTSQYSPSEASYSPYRESTTIGNPPLASMVTDPEVPNG